MMKILIAGLTLISLAACGGGGGGSAGAAVVLPDEPIVASRSATSSGSIQTTAKDANFGRLLNDYRLASGVGAVSFDSRLNRAAQQHSDDMVKRGYFEHESPEGKNVADRVRSQGYDYKWVAENIAWRQTSDGQVFKDWQDSKSHDAAMKDGNAEDFGLGVSGSGNNTKWALVLGAEK